MIKQSGAAISSKLMPPNVGSKRFTVSTISSILLVFKHKGNESTPAKDLNKNDFPSITSSYAYSLIFTIPRPTVQLLTTAIIIYFILYESKDIFLYYL